MLWFSEVPQIPNFTKNIVLSWKKNLFIFTKSTDSQQHVKWRKSIKMLGQNGSKLSKNKAKKGSETKRKSNSRPLNTELDQYLMDIFIEKRAKSFPVSGSLIQTLASQAPPHLKSVGFTASIGWLEKFLRRNFLTRRKKTHQAQILLDFISRETLNYINLISGFQCSSQDFVYVNFDEMHVAFDLAMDYTLHFQGEKTIAIS